MLFNNLSNTISGNTPLHWSTLFNNLEVTDLLISKQANAEAFNEDGLTPLDNAERHEICKSYLQEVLRQNHELIFASRIGDKERVRIVENEE